MTTPKKKKGKKSISPQLAREWLRQLETGTGITKIADDNDSDVRTVRHHIEKARQEREEVLARRDFLTEKIEEHQEDLLRELVNLQKLLARHAPTTVIPDDPDRKKKFSALGEHVGDSMVDKQLKAWENHFAKYTEYKKTVSRELGTKERALVSDIPGEPELCSWTDGILDVLESGLTVEQSGRTYRREQQEDGKYKVSWGDRILTRSGVSDKQAAQLIESHKKLITYAQKYLPGFKKQAQPFKELAGPLMDGLDIYRMKRVVSGRCRYCPA